MSFVSDFDAVVDCPGLSPAELGLLIYFFRNQGDSFLFIIDVILQKFDIAKPTYRKLKKTLLDRGFITSEKEYVNGRNTGCKITVLIENIKAEVAKAKAKKIEVKNIEGKNINLNNIDRNNLTHQEKGVKREGSKKEKGVKAAVAAEGDRLSASAGAAASEAVPAAAAAADSPSPEISRSQDNKPRQSSKAAKASKAAETPLALNPPTQADVEACISRQVSGHPNKDLWTSEAVSAFAWELRAKNSARGWISKDGTPYTSLDALVFSWLRNVQWKPPVIDEPAPAPAPHPSPVPAASPAPNELSGLLPGQWAGTPIQKPQQKSFKQLEKEWIERPLTDPDTFIVETAAHSIFNATCEDEVQGTLNSTPVHLRERALALAEQMRKEQGDRPRIITTPSTFTYENEDETS